MAICCIGQAFVSSRNYNPMGYLTGGASPTVDIIGDLLRKGERLRSAMLSAAVNEEVPAPTQYDEDKENRW